MAIAFGIVCGLMEVLGDLAESRVKRNSGFKDSGTIMPATAACSIDATPFSWRRSRR